MMARALRTHAEEQMARAIQVRELATRRLKTGEGGQTVYEYRPGAMDIADPNVIRGYSIRPDEPVVIVRSDVDPLHKIVWIMDVLGNEQSVWRAALRPIRSFRNRASHIILVRERRWNERFSRFTGVDRRPDVHVGGYRRSIVDQFGHRIRVPEWPSEAGFSKLRRHNKRFYPRAFAASIRKGVATRARRLRR